ncbi:probable anion transporter 6, chloroplastic [Physcomitrium patens]|uniref:Major facilitator superfamily (MFS) profile domain-containing protein n=1 Tax=Physcomitrium patens TaxID=3218 RepID=A0A2K1KM71_PHYPA|nr:probable anion transporter 6, chloroplastic [Physcomitrium patens]PNR54869.1 hypothetical protein PHYPA_005762 [Physcomitrium patens]|eukprot:XP_024374370.1 probable anion transporter 6, chloroplastic [Physcomitrella patens]
MRGLDLNSTAVHPSCLVQTGALEFLSHISKGKRQSGIRFSINRVPHQLLLGKRSSVKSRKSAPLCNNNKFPGCNEKRVYISPVYASPPDVPVREIDVQDGEENGEKSQVVPEDIKLTQELQGSSKSWRSLPPRYKLILTTAFAFVICNMDKVNMSVAIIPMSHELGWSSTTAGLVQSSFFWGYCISQLPGGWLAKAFSGQRVLRAGVLIWSLATAIVPSTARILPLLLFSRFAVGLGEGVSPSAATDLIARAMPVSERSRAVATVFGGLNVGSVVGLLLAPIMIEIFGWESVFYAFGFLGVVWSLLFESAVGSSMLGNKSTISEPPSPTPEKSVEGNEHGAHGSVNGDLRARKTQSMEVSNDKSQLSAEANTSTDKNIPWKAFFKSSAVWAMIYAHFCGNWGHYTLLSWLPTYFSQELHLDLTHAALVSILPPLASVAVTSVAAPLADHFISRGYDITLVRKVCQSIGFLSPAACMAFAALSPKFNPWVDVAILTAGLGLSSFTLAGLYCTHQDISPKYASVLLGITNSIGAIPGVLGVALVGIILDRTQSWNLALFVPSIFFYLTGALVWNIFASSKPQSFES